jgi:hypothetical protein
MVERYSLLPEFDVAALRFARPARARVQKPDHSLRCDINELGYSVEDEATIGTREYYIIRLDDSEAVLSDS